MNTEQGLWYISWSIEWPGQIPPAGYPKGPFSIPFDTQGDAERFIREEAEREPGVWGLSEPKIRYDADGGEPEPRFRAILLLRDGLRQRSIERAVERFASLCAVSAYCQGIADETGANIELLDGSHWLSKGFHKNR